MQKVYAQVTDDVVEQLFFCETREPFELMFGYHSEYVEVSAESGVPFIGLKCYNGKFQPTESSEWSDELQEWKVS